MEKVLVLHGFASIGKPFYNDPDIEYITPTFDYTDVEGTLKKIDEIVKKENIELIIGKSTGGWYAMKYFDIYKNTAIIAINPLLFPEKHFKTGIYKNYHTNEEINITEEVIKNYEKFKIEYPFSFSGSVFLGKKDDVLNHTEALKYLKPKYGFEIFDDEGHRFSEKGKEKVNKTVREFLFQTFLIEGSEDFED